MNFCAECEKLMVLQEKLNEHTHKKELYYICEGCGYKNFKVSQPIFFNSYHNTLKSHQSFPDMNKYKVNDITLPFEISECPHCNIKSINKVEKVYSKTKYQFYFNHICSNCFNTW